MSRQQSDLSNQTSAIRRLADLGFESSVSNLKSEISRLKTLIYSVVGFLCFAPANVQAQFTIQNGTINSSPAAMHGKQFSVAGSAGQPVTGLAGGGGFQTTGGVEQDAPPFMVPIVPTVVVQSGPPRLISVGWVPHSSGYVLEFTDTLRSPVWFAYPQVTNNEAAFQYQPWMKKLFFRLRKVEPNPTQ